MAGEARLIKLDEVSPGGDQGSELGIDDRHEGRRDGPSAVVGRPGVDAAGKRERPGNGHFDGGGGEFTEPAQFGDGSQPVGCCDRAGRAVPVALIVGRPPRTGRTAGARCRGGSGRTRG